MDLVLVLDDGKYFPASLRRVMRQILSTSPYVEGQGRRDFALALAAVRGPEILLESPL